MAARPSDTSAFAEAVYAQLAPIADQDQENGWALLIFIAALGVMFDDIDQLAHSSPAWSLLLDVDNIPAKGLPWLGQFIGVVVNTNLSENQQRDQIRNHLGWGRGTVAALINSVKPYLTGTQTVIVDERDTSPYHFTLSTYSAESPPDITYSNLYADFATYQDFYNAYATYQAYWLTDDREQIRLIITASKPAGLQFDYTVIAGSP